MWLALFLLWFGGFLIGFGLAFYVAAWAVERQNY